MTSDSATVTGSDVLQVLSRVDLPSVEFQVSRSDLSVRSIGDGVNDVFVVTPTAARADPLIVKFGNYSSARDLRAGVAAYRLLARYTSLPVPTIHATDFTGEAFPPVVIMESLPGEPLATGFQETERLTDLEVVRLLGTVIDEFSRIPDRAVDGYGYIEQIESRDGALTAVGEYEDFAPWLIDYVRDFYDDPPAHEGLESVAPSVVEYLDAHRDWVPSGSRRGVVVTDLSPQNLLCPEETSLTDSDALTGVIDLERAKLGPAEFTAVNAEYLLTLFVDDTGPVRDALYDSLPFGPDVAARDLYHVIAMGRSVGALPHWYEPGSETYRQRGDAIAAELTQILG